MLMIMMMMTNSVVSHYMMPAKIMEEFVIIAITQAETDGLHTVFVT